MALYPATKRYVLYGSEQMRLLDMIIFDFTKSLSLLEYTYKMCKINTQVIL